ncbi:MAG: hypothetical protein KDJ65_37085, partial [Anaerolineae bacterium]|nr:hypothetical protein [Anaerolineae bacterium]
SGPEPTVAQTDNGYTVVVTDTNGEGSTISDVQATTIPVYQWGGNLRIPLANINKIEGISEASFGFSLMRITMSDGQIIEGETNRGSINGNLAGVKYTINVPNIHSMAIVNKPASAQKTDVSSNLYDKITAIVLTQTGEELSLSEVEMIWLNNSSDLSDSDWFTLYKGGGELRLNLSEVKTIQIEQEGSKKSIAVETSAGSVLKGAPKYGWYIAGKIDGKENLGLFVIGLEDLSSANLGT